MIKTITNTHLLGNDYTEELYSKNEKKILGIKCKICGRFWKNPNDEHHEKDCIYNVKTVADWEFEENKRMLKFLNHVQKEFKNQEKAQKMSNKEICDYLINNIWSKMDMGSMDAAVLDEIINRLDK